MADKKRAVIIIENSSIPYDIRVWYEALSLRDNGWDVTVICPCLTSAHLEAYKSTNPRDLEGITLYQFELKIAEEGIIGYFLEYWSAFFNIMKISWRVWKNEKFDTIQFCNPPDIFFPLGIFYRLLGVGVIFDLHDLFPEFVASRYKGFKGRLLGFVAQVTEFLSFRSSHVVITTNESYQSVAVQRGRLQKDRVKVVRNGPRIEQFSPVEPDLKLKQGFRYMACYAGVMGHLDGVLELQESIRYILQELNRSDIFFVLLGNGAVYQEVIEQNQKLGIQANVYMPGMIRDKNLLVKYLSTSDVCLSPEPYTPLNAISTFIKIGEYMAVGKPVVAYDLVESRYTAQEAGVYVTPGNYKEYARAILSLMDDPEKREVMGKFGRERITNTLRWGIQEKKLLQAYQFALEG